MKKRKIIVIGGMAAGPSAAAKAVRINPNAEVILFEQSEDVSYGICEVPYLISGEIDDEEKLVIYSPEKLSQEKGIIVKTLHKVEKIIPAKHKIIVRDLSANELKEYNYDKLIIATGASPKKLGVDNENLRNVFYLRSRDDAKSILNFLKTENPTKAVIIGGGFIGIEMSEALRNRNLDVTLIHQHSLPLNSFETEASEQVLAELKKNNINFISNAKTEALIKSKNEKVEYVITNKGTFEADIILIAIGLVQNVTLAKNAGVRLGTSGAILVNNYQETNIDGIYAIGDCVEVKNIVNGKYSYIPLATVASKSARVAGENAAGGRAKFDGAINSSGIRVFNLEAAKAGLSSTEAAQSGYKIVTGVVTSNSKIPFMPDNKNISIKIIADQKTKRILGINVWGENGVIQRANVLATAIQQKLTIDDLSKLDLLYSPPFSPLWDPIHIAANALKKKLQ